MEISPLFVLGVGMVVILAWERIAPSHSLPQSRGWWLRVGLVYLLILGVMALGNSSWNRWLLSWNSSPPLPSLAPWAVALLAYLGWTLGFYWWHRLCHKSDFLWRLVHQLHHSPVRIEALTAFYLHPLDYLTSSLIAGTFLFAVLGGGTDAAAYYFAYSALINAFIHSNIRAPRWLGYIVQTPEMHRAHHEAGCHRSNYGTVVLWDMLFGTYQHPTRPIESCGFEGDVDHRLGAMLVFQDVTRDKGTIRPRSGTESGRVSNH